MSDCTTVAGVDGCPGGWVVVERSGGELTARRIEDLTPLVAAARSGAVDVVAIDMPIGLLDGPRRCDVEARRVLGPRRSSVFPAPVRATLDAVDYADACDRSRRACGRALSKQAYNLLPKIRELDALLVPGDQARIVEAHPEAAFARLACRPLDHPKRTPEGRAERRALLGSHDQRLATLLAEATDLPSLDLVDAAALTITAGHVAAGTEHRLGDEVDARGLLAQVVY